MLFIIIFSFFSAPPKAVEITNHPSNSKLEVKEGEDVSLECLVKNAKPAARIVWFRGNVELKGDKVSKEEIREVENENGNPKAMRYTTVSRYVNYEYFYKPSVKIDQYFEKNMY
ncbi:hypothetical protein B5X24_HaOG209357 [Helicoverpa armigera]|nr:hypothetical protein B5X24_HaOG209357 [Helicoverpa armigera]